MGGIILHNFMIYSPKCTKLSVLMLTLLKMEKLRHGSANCAVKECIYLRLLRYPAIFLARNNAAV